MDCIFFIKNIFYIFNRFSVLNVSNFLKLLWSILQLSPLYLVGQLIFPKMSHRKLGLLWTLMVRPSTTVPLPYVASSKNELSTPALYRHKCIKSNTKLYSLPLQKFAKEWIVPLHPKQILCMNQKWFNKKSIDAKIFVGERPGWPRLEMNMSKVNDENYRKDSWM